MVSKRNQTRLTYFCHFHASKRERERERDKKREQERLKEREKGISERNINIQSNVSRDKKVLNWL